MSEQFIGPRIAGATLIINGTDYKTTTTSLENEFTIDQEDVTTFNDEPDGAYEEGRSMARLRFAMRLKKGSAAANPPVPPPQGATVSACYNGTSNAFTGIVNFSRLLIRRDAMAVGVIAGEGVYVGAVVKQWQSS